MPNQKLLAAEHGLEIDPEFAAVCPGKSADETAQLRRSLIAEGCRDDLVVWNGTKKILDGRHRHELCIELGIPYGVTRLDLPDRAACLRWIVANQLARRNISSLAASYFRGTQYLLEVRSQKEMNGNGEPESHGETLQISTRMAEEFHVGRATIFRDATFATAVDAITATCGQEAKQIILGRENAITRRVVLLLAAMSAEERQKAIEGLIENGKLPSRRGAGEKSTITLPRDPKALAEKLIERLGVDACCQVAAELKTLLPKPNPQRKQEQRNGKDHGKTRRLLTTASRRATPIDSIATRSASKETAGELLIAGCKLLDQDTPGPARPTDAPIPSRCEGKESGQPASLNAESTSTAGAPSCKCNSNEVKRFLERVEASDRLSRDT